MVHGGRDGPSQAMGQSERREVAIQRFHLIPSIQTPDLRWFSYLVTGSHQYPPTPELNLGETSDLETISTPLRINTRNYINWFCSNLVSPGSGSLRIASARQGRKLECGCRLHGRRRRAVIEYKPRCAKDCYRLGKSRRLCRADLQRFTRHSLPPLDAWPRP